VKFPDHYMPSTLSYFTFNPALKPIRAKPWGYYILMLPDRGAWIGLNKLGLGPDAEENWKRKYLETPPDAIILGLHKENSLRYILNETEVILKRQQDVSMTWLRQRINEDYLCREYSDYQILVHKLKTEPFEKIGWHDCQERL
jgi:hypothetical protein